MSEIDEVGKALADLLKPGSRLDRSRRGEVRALLREGFLATQEERTLEELLATLTRLRRLSDDLLGTETPPLAERVAQHRDFGAFDDALLQIGTFRPSCERNADEMAKTIQDRLDRVLALLSRDLADEERGGQRPIQVQPEAKELITKRV